MDWEEAVELYGAYVAKDIPSKRTRKDPEERKKKAVDDARFMLEGLPKLSSLRIEEINGKTWIEAFEEYKKRNRVRNWGQIYDRSYFREFQKCVAFARDGYRCSYCGREANSDLELHPEHRVPRSEGGGEDIGNLLTSCHFCNLGKKHMSAEWLIDQVVEITKSVKKRYPDRFE